MFIADNKCVTEHNKCFFINKQNKLNPLHAPLRRPAVGGNHTVNEVSSVESKRKISNDLHEGMQLLISPTHKWTVTLTIGHADK